MLSIHDDDVLRTTESDLLRDIFGTDDSDCPGGAVVARRHDPLSLASVIDGFTAPPLESHARVLIQMAEQSSEWTSLLRGVGTQELTRISVHPMPVYRHFDVRDLRQMIRRLHPEREAILDGIMSKTTGSEVPASSSVPVRPLSRNGNPATFGSPAHSSPLKRRRVDAPGETVIVLDNADTAGAIASASGSKATSNGCDSKHVASHVTPARAGSQPTESVPAAPAPGKTKVSRVLFEQNSLTTRSPSVPAKVTATPTPTPAPVSASGSGSSHTPATAPAPVAPMTPAKKSATAAAAVSSPGKGLKKKVATTVSRFQEIKVLVRGDVKFPDGMKKGVCHEGMYREHLVVINPYGLDHTQWSGAVDATSLPSSCSDETISDAVKRGRLQRRHLVLCRVVARTLVATDARHTAIAAAATSDTVHGHCFRLAFYATNPDGQPVACAFPTILERLINAQSGSVVSKCLDLGDYWSVYKSPNLASELCYPICHPSNIPACFGGGLDVLLNHSAFTSWVFSTPENQTGPATAVSRELLERIRGPQFDDTRIWSNVLSCNLRFIEFPCDPAVALPSKIPPFPSPVVFH